MWILKEWSSNHKPTHFGWMHREVICIHYELIVPFVIIFIWFIRASARSVTPEQTTCVKIVSWIRFKQKPGRWMCALSEILISKTNKTSLGRPNPKSSVVQQISAYNHGSFEMCPSLSEWSCEIHTSLSSANLVWQFWFGLGLIDQSCGSCCSAS